MLCSQEREISVVAVSIINAVAGLVAASVVNYLSCQCSMAPQSNQSNPYKADPVMNISAPGAVRGNEDFRPGLGPDSGAGSLFLHAAPE